MAVFYITLSEADLSRKPEKKVAKDEISRKPKVIHMKKEAKPSETSQTPITAMASEQAAPSVHINLQIHISSDATPDQIDKIFESIAKHIYRK